MFGVVLWSEADDRKAVIWCEDQGDLAFLDGTHEQWSNATSDFFIAGDMVHFDVSIGSKMRKATNVELVQQQAGANLPLALLRGAGQQSQGDADVIDLSEARRQRQAKATAQRKEVNA